MGPPNKHSGGSNRSVQKKQPSWFRISLDKGRVELIAALTGLIKHDQDRIMIIDLGPADGGADDRIEFIGVRAEDSSRKAVIV